MQVIIKIVNFPMQRIGFLTNFRMQRVGFLNYKEKIMPHKEIKWKKKHVQKKRNVKPWWRKNCQNTIVKPKIFHLSSKMLSRYQTKIFLRALKFTHIPKRNNSELKFNMQNNMHRLQLEFFLNKEAYDSEESLFQKQSTLILLETGIHQINVLNNLKETHTLKAY